MRDGYLTYYQGNACVEVRDSAGCLVAREYACIDSKHNHKCRLPIVAVSIVVKSANAQGYVIADSYLK